MKWLAGSDYKAATGTTVIVSIHLLCNKIINLLSLSSALLQYILGLRA